MPLQRRLPKLGFTSRKSRVTAEIRLSELALLDAEVIDLDSLKAANIISKNIRFAKVILSGEISKSVTLKGIGATKGAQSAIEAAGGKVEA